MMKERTNPKSVAPRKVKGTVLFTVVVVMMVLVVFLMGALALAATANQRAANTYSTAQTQATARAGVDAIISAMQNSEDIAKAAAGIKNESGKTKVQIGAINFGYMDNVTDDEGNVVYGDDGKATRAEYPVSALGRITDSYIEYVGTKPEVQGDGTIVEKTIIKVCATAQQGTAESTYTAYILRNANLESTTDGENQGFISTGSAVSCNHTNVYGGAYIGFDGIYKNQTLWETNLAAFIANPSGGALGTFKATDSHVVYETDFMVNGTFSNDTGSPVYLVVKSQKSGMTVWGNCELAHEMFIETANCYTSAYTDAAGITYREVPYLYVEGDIKFNGPDQVIGPKDSSNKIPFNVFCGSIQDAYANSHASSIMADVYCYDTSKTSTLRHGNTTKLYQWGSAKIKDYEGNLATDVGGSYYTKGSLEVDGKVDISGDLVVEKDLKITSGSTLTVGGNVMVRGNVTADGELKIGQNGYFGSSAALSNGNIKLDGAATSIPMINDPDYEPKTAVNHYYAEWDATTNPYWQHWQVFMTSTVEGVTSAPTDTGNAAGNNSTAPDAVWVGGVQKNYPYDEEGQVWVSKTTGAISATQPKIVDPGYTPPAGTYVKSALDPAMVIFPKEYEKNVILGKTVPTGAPGVAEDYKIIKTVPEILTASSDPYATIFKPGTCNTEVSLGSGCNVISDSCTLTGNYSDGRGVVVRAPASGNEIWIKLKDFSLSGSYFIIDDTNGGTGAVNIFVEGEVKFCGGGNESAIDLSDGTSWPAASQKFNYLSCARVVKAFCDSSQDYQIYTDASLKKPGVAEVPKPILNIYSGANFKSDLVTPDTDNTAAVSKLIMDNSNSITAHVKAPYMDYQQTSQGSATPASTLYYNGYDVMANPSFTYLGCYGCMICHEFSAGNNWLMMFDGASGTGTPPIIFDDALYTNWKILAYDNY